MRSDISSEMLGLPEELAELSTAGITSEFVAEKAAGICPPMVQTEIEMQHNSNIA